MTKAEKSAHFVARIIGGAKYHLKELEARKKEILKHAAEDCICDDEYVCGPCLARREVNRGSETK